MYSCSTRSLRRPCRSPVRSATHHACTIATTELIVMATLQITAWPARIAPVRGIIHACKYNRPGEAFKSDQRGAPAPPAPPPCGPKALPSGSHREEDATPARTDRHQRCGRAAAQVPLPPAQAGPCPGPPPELPPLVVALSAAVACHRAGRYSNGVAKP